MRLKSITIGAVVFICASFFVTDILLCSDKVKIYSMVICAVIGGVFGNSVNDELQKTEKGNLKK